MKGKGDQRVHTGGEGWRVNWSAVMKEVDKLGGNKWTGNGCVKVGRGRLAKVEEKI